MLILIHKCRQLHFHMYFCNVIFKYLLNMQSHPLVGAWISKLSYKSKTPPASQQRAFLQLGISSFKVKRLYSG